MSKKTINDVNFPFVSVITPTYNRRKFIPSLVKCFLSQTYPQDRMEWIVLDDGSDKVEDLFPKLPNLRYIYESEKLNIGQKRNRLNREARGEIIVAMDDDDFYFPERVASVVKAFRLNPAVQLAGASEIFIYFSDTKEIYKLGPYHKNHATNGTMAWRRTYAATHRYDDTVTFAEERSFLEEYKNPMIQLDPFKCILVMCHSDNTFDKNNLRDSNNPMLKDTDMNLKTFIKDKGLRTFFATC